MRKLQLNKDENQVYSTTGFKDTLASPIFYPVIVVALVLGTTSIFGFIQNPLKLKSMATVIQQKVTTTNVVSDSYQNKLFSMTADEQSATAIEPQSEKSISTFDLFPSATEANTEKMPVDSNIERIAFNYDITSENFWTNLDSSSIETAEEEQERKNKQAITIGAPLEIDFHESNTQKPSQLDASIYSLRSSSKI